MKQRLKILTILFIFSISGALGFFLSLHQYSLKQKKSIQTIETFHYPALFVSQLKSDPLAGKKIFKEFCALCHGKPPAIDVNAPIIGSKEWTLLKKQGMKSLLKTTLTGRGAMPARGGCFECSDEQLQQTIEYILKYKKGKIK